MKILVTGATSNIGKGVVPLLEAAGHTVSLSDLVVAPEWVGGRPYVQCDVQHGFGLEAAAAGCEAMIHLPAWHGIHWGQKTEIDYWRLNIDGTFYALQAAQRAGIRRAVFLSSQAWHGHYDKYGFTKRIGEELCEYQRRNHGIGYVAVRPADLTPYGGDYLNRFGCGFLYGRVHRDDVLRAVVQSVAYLDRQFDEAPGLVLDAVRPNAFTADQIERWDEDPSACADAIWPGSAELIAKYDLQIARKPHLTGSFLGWDEVGYASTYHFGSFVEELRRLDAELGEAEVRRMTCPY